MTSQRVLEGLALWELWIETVGPRQLSATSQRVLEGLTLRELRVLGGKVGKGSPTSTGNCM